MGLVNNSNAIYLSISEGKIVRQFKNPTKDSKERTNKSGKIVHEEFYSAVEGRIIKIDTKDNEYGRFWMITLQDEESRENFILQMNYSSGYANGFLKALPNVDLSSKVKLSPSSKTEGDKKKTTLFINQKGEAIKWAYTKDNPNGMPELEQKKVKGKVVWDDSEIMAFLEAMVVEKILPQLKNGSGKVEEPLEEAPF